MGSALDFSLDRRDSGTFIIDPPGRIRPEEKYEKKMNIQTDIIPMETSTTQTSTSTITMSTLTSLMETVTSMAQTDTTEENFDDFPPAVNREFLIEGLSEIQKDIFIISLSGLVLILMILLVVICLKWRKSRGRTYEIQNMSAGSSMTIFNSSKID